MTKGLSYFAYISRAKVSQLYDQITDFAVEQRTVRRGKEAETSAEAGAGGFFGFLKASLNVGGKISRAVEEVGTMTTIQKAIKVIEYIEEHENVPDLNDLCKREKGVSLDAFCYRYEGEFFTLGHLSRNKDSYGGLNISAAALAKAGDEILISKDLLINPARNENAFMETGPNNGSLVSNMCIISSNAFAFTLELACSYKYFSDMGGEWRESDKEWAVVPHSGNHFFFNGESTSRFESLLFINGIRGRTIFGTPLFLTYSRHSSLAI